MIFAWRMWLSWPWMARNEQNLISRFHASLPCCSYRHRPLSFEGKKRRSWSLASLFSSDSHYICFQVPPLNLLSVLECISDASHQGVLPVPSKYQQEAAWAVQPEERDTISNSIAACIDEPLCEHEADCSFIEVNKWAGEQSCKCVCIHVMFETWSCWYSVTPQSHFPLMWGMENDTFTPLYECFCFICGCGKEFL